MTSSAILSLFDHLSNEARNSVHATFGLMEFRPIANDPALQTCLDATRTSADRLLRNMDDMRELLAGEVPVSTVAEEFDLQLCVGEIIDLLNLASAQRARRLVLETPTTPIVVRQNRQAVEQVLSRILGTASKRSGDGILHANLSAGDQDFVRLGITPPSSDLAQRLADWLNADMATVEFPTGDEVAFGVPLLLAGRRLRALGGSAEFVCSAGAPTGLALLLPRQTQNAAAENTQVRRDSISNALNILVAEDCDESYALTALLLNDENVARARTGLEAVDLVRAHRFDIVFMDIHMPGMDGYRAIQAVRDWETMTGNARTPVVVLSSDDLDTQSRSAAQAGCSGYLRKPVRKADVAELLDRLRAVRALTS